jgi:hypothetical protein
VSASGVLTTSDIVNGDGSFTVTGITGTRTFNNVATDTITGLLAPGSIVGSDNKLFTAGPVFLSGGGIVFTISANNAGDGGNRVNVYFSGASTGYTENANPIQYGAFSITPVPEPSTWALMLGGLGVLAWSQRRRRPAPAMAA